ncbi:MAG: hypothetical protein HQL08_03705 [Nitrospirae bacterium]|nr:hypothetical protein [Nitrospirota bacterium]
MKTSRFFTAALLAVFSIMLFAGITAAEDKILIKGNIKNFNIKERTVTVTTAEGKDMTFVIENDSALKKLGDSLEKGDEVKIKYIIHENKNIIKGGSDLKGTKAGC